MTTVIYGVLMKCMIIGCLLKRNVMQCGGVESLPCLVITLQRLCSQQINSRSKFHVRKILEVA